jgi:FkbM family methyltransferase
VYQPRPGDLIIDAGAGKGEDTIVFSRAAGPIGKVFSIEAHPTTFRCLPLFCELNHLQNVVPVNFALHDSARPVAIENLEGWHANRIVDAGTKGALQVAGISLDELLERENVQRIDFLKMNIEGAEALAIRGMDRTLRITRALSISCHDFRAGAGEGEFFRTRQLISGLRGARRLQNNLARLGPASGHRLPGECPSRLTPLFSTTCCKILKLSFRTKSAE